MLKLIELEIKKFKLWSYLKGILIANIAIIGLIILISFAEKSDGNIAFQNYEMMFMAAQTFIRSTFIIFASVIISRIIIEEYRSKTISLLFMYPINRKKLMVSKLIIVVVFTIGTIILSNFLIGSVHYLVESIINFIPEPITLKEVTDHLIRISTEAVASAGISLIPLYFGMRKKSVPATIVSSIVLVSFLGSSSDQLSLFSVVAIPISLAVAGGLIAFFSIRNIETKDIN